MWRRRHMRGRGGGADAQRRDRNGPTFCAFLQFSACAVGYYPPNKALRINDVLSQAWLRQGRPKPASKVRSSEK